jgi:hypothetical protein
LRWLLLLEEYVVTFEYHAGKKNIVADVLSRLEINCLKIQEEIAQILNLTNIKIILFTK